ncbi:tripartite tricarboxylate transporter substrate binding protein [soil metagenome]
MNPKPRALAILHLGKSLLAATAAALFVNAVLPSLATAQAYPSKPIHVIVPAVAGSSADVLARIVGEHAGKASGQPWIIENKPGAGGIIGSDAVAKSAGDGYTLLFTANNFIISPSIYDTVPYDVYKDFAPIGLVTATPNVVFINSSLGVKNMADLVALGKKTPEGLNYGSPFVGTSAHLIMEMLKRSAGIDMLHVPAKGMPQAFNEALAGRVPVVIGSVLDGAGFVSQGSITPLAVADTKRSPMLPNVPTLAEAGFPGLGLPLWFGLYAPKATPTPVVDTLNRQLQSVLINPEVVAALAKVGFDPRPGSPAQLVALMQTEQPLYTKIVKEIGIKP